jgi:hypothetical protein
MVNKIIKPQQIQWLAILFILLLLAPYIYLSFFMHPAADDFNYAFQSISKGWLNENINQYFTWSGRYTSNIFLLANPLVYHNLTVYRILPIVFIVLTFSSFYFLLASVYNNLINKKTLIIIALTITLFSLFSMPDLAEGIYWYTGSVIYQASVIFFITYMALFYRYSTGRYLLNKISHAFICILLAVITAGSNEIVIIVLLLFHLILSGKAIIGHKHNRTYYLVLSALVIIASVFSFTAPGNAVRAGYFENNHLFLNSIGMSLLQTFRFLSDWMSNLPFIILSLLFIVFTRDINTKVGLFKNPTSTHLFLFGLSLPAVIFISVFPPYWSTGILGQQRTVNVGFFLFILFWLINLNLWTSYFKEHYIFINLEKIINKRSSMVLFITAIIVMSATENGYNAATDIFYRKAFMFDREITLRNKLIKESKEKGIYHISIDPLKNKPPTIFVLDITADSSNWINSGFACYYGLKSVILSKTLNSQIKE